MYCTTGKFRELRKIGNFVTGKFREFWFRGGHSLSNGGFRLKIGPFIRKEGNFILHRKSLVTCHSEMFPCTPPETCPRNFICLGLGCQVESRPSHGSSPSPYFFILHSLYSYCNPHLLFTNPPICVLLTFSPLNPGASFVIFCLISCSPTLQ